MTSVEKMSATNSHSDLMAFFKSGQDNNVGNSTVNMSESEARTLACDLDYGVQVCPSDMLHFVNSAVMSRYLTYF